MRKRRFWGKITAGLLAVSLSLQGTAALAAEPKRVEKVAPSGNSVDLKNSAFLELSEVLEAFGEKKSPSLLEETLGLEKIKEKIKQEGEQITLSLTTSDGTMNTLGVSEEFFQKVGGELYWRHDPKKKEWTLRLSGNGDGKELLTGQLWGDTEKLLLSVPQFSQKAVGIRSGNLMEQYQDSALETLLGDENPDLPDMDLHFYPEEGETFDGGEEARRYQSHLEERVKEQQDRVQVEKEELSGQRAVYHLSYATADLLDLYNDFLQETMVYLTDSGVMQRHDAMDFLNEMTEVLGSTEEMLADEITVDFYTEEELLKKVCCRLYMDTTDYEAQTYQPKAYDDDFDLSLEVEESFDGYVEYEVVFEDPEQPRDTFDFSMKVCDSTGRQEMMNVWMTKQTKSTETVSETTFTLMVKEEGQIIYWGIPLTVSFDAETGDLDVLVSLDTDWEPVILRLDSSFQDVRPGQSFVWRLDDLTLEADGDRIGLNGELKVEATAGALEEPEEVSMIFEASQGELFLLFNEIMARGEIWASQFEPETESWTEPETEAETEIRER